MRRTTVGNAMWIPKPSDRVCSNHFVDKEPTPDHPDPTIQLGYDFVPTQRRRELFRQPVAKNVRICLCLMMKQCHFWLILQI